MQEDGCKDEKFERLSDDGGRAGGPPFDFRIPAKTKAIPVGDFKGLAWPKAEISAFTFKYNENAKSKGKRSKEMYFLAT